MGQRSRRIAADHRRRISESRSDVQVHQASVLFGDRRAVIPAQAPLHGERRAYDPVVIDKQVVHAGLEILIGVSEGDCAGVRNSQKETGEIEAGRQSVETEGPARVALCEYAEILNTVIGPERKSVRPMDISDAAAERGGLIPVERRCAVRKRRNAAAARKPEAWRTPVDGGLIVPRDAGLAGNVGLVSEERRRQRGGPAVIYRERGPKRPRKIVIVLEVGAVIGSAIRVQERKDIGSIAAALGVSEAAIQAVLSPIIERLVDPRIQLVGPATADGGSVVVVGPRGGCKLRQRVVVQQIVGLRADPADRNDTVGERLAGGGVHQGNGAATGGSYLREVPRPLSRRRHHRGIILGRPILRHAECRAEISLPAKQVRD